MSTGQRRYLAHTRRDKYGPGVFSGIQQCALRKTHNARSRGGKTNAAESLSTFPIQRRAEIYAHTPVCLQCGRAPGTLCVNGHLSYLSEQFVLIITVHSIKKEPADKNCTKMLQSLALDTLPSGGRRDKHQGEKTSDI